MKTLLTSSLLLLFAITGSAAAATGQSGHLPDPIGDWDPRNPPPILNIYDPDALRRGLEDINGDEGCVRYPREFPVPKPVPEIDFCPKTCTIPPCCSPEPEIPNCGKRDCFPEPPRDPWSRHQYVKGEEVTIDDRYWIDR